MSAKYKIQLGEYEIQLQWVLRHGQTTQTSDPAVPWEEDVNHTPKNGLKSSQTWAEVSEKLAGTVSSETVIVMLAKETFFKQIIVVHVLNIITL